MRDAHPVAAVVLVGVALPVLLTAQPLPLACLAGALLATGLLWGGSRQAAFGFGLAGALLTTLWWLLVVVLVPPPATGSAIFTLGPWRLGPGAVIGGPVTTDGLAAAGSLLLRAVGVLLLLGLWGQLVAARDQVRLTRSTVGLLTPAVAPAASLGEAAALAATDGRRFGGGPGTWLTGWMRHARDLGRQLDLDPPAPLWADAVRLVALLAAMVAAVAFPRGVWGLVVLAGAVVLLGLALPGVPAGLRRLHTSDVWLLAVAVAVAAIHLWRPDWVAAVVWLLPFGVLAQRSGHA